VASFQFDRNLRRSLFDYARGLLASPPANTFANAWNVYEHDQMVSTTFVPTRPFVYLVDRYIEPVVDKVPLIVVEIDTVAKMPHEVGNRNGHVAACALDIFGDTRGSRDDLSSFLRDQFGLTFPIMDYGTSGSPVIDTAFLLDEPSVTTLSLGEDVGKEGSLWNFNVMSFDILSLT
jgi:hypothetical protein